MSKERTGPSQTEDKVKNIRAPFQRAEGAAGFVRTQEQLRVGGFSAGQVRTPAYMFRSVI